MGGVSGEHESQIGSTGRGKTHFVDFKETACKMVLEARWKGGKRNRKTVINNSSQAIRRRVGATFRDETLVVDLDEEDENEVNILDYSDLDDYVSISND